MVEKTYRVLVADDEYWICENLRQLIKWEDYGLKFLEPASDGEEVLERMKEEVPDILITDINMPFINGLELLKAIHIQYPSVVLMVLSGYDDFPKVKTAFLEGCINYLLKPIDKLELVNALSKALEIIGERDAERLKEEEQMKEAQKAASFLRDNEYSMLISDGTSGMNSGLFQGYSAAGCLSMLLIKFHDMTRLTEQYHHDMLWMSYSVKKRIRETLGEETLCVFNYSYRINEFILYGELSEVQKSEAAKLLIAIFPESEAGPITIVLGGGSFQIENLKEAYHDVIARLMARPFTSQSVVVSQKQQVKEDIQAVYSKEEEKELVVLIEKGDRKGLQKYIMEHIGVAHAMERKWTLLKMRQTVRKIMNQLIYEVGDGQLSLKQSLSYELLADKADQEINKLNLSAVEDLIGELIVSMSDESKAIPSDSMQASIQRAIRYVDQHYTENISLNELAEKFHVEPTYFSKLYRQESGENLIPYIVKKRMEYAVSLMKKSELSLTEISYLAGYDDYGYFNRVFRKYKNYSPKDYRNQCRQQGEQLEKKKERISR